MIYMQLNSVALFLAKSRFDAEWGKGGAGMKKIGLALCCLLVFETVGCADMPLLSGLVNRVSTQTTIEDNFVIVDLGHANGRTIAIALSTAKSTGRDTQSSSHWLIEDVFQYDVILSKGGEDLANVTVFPKSGQLGAKFARLQSGFLYEVRVIARGNEGGTAPDIVLNAQNPAVGTFDFTSDCDPSPKAVDVNVVLDGDGRTGIINIHPIEGSEQAATGSALAVPLSLTPRIIGLKREDLFISNSPWALALDTSGTLFLSDWGGNNIVRIAPDGTKTIFAGKAEGLWGGGESFMASFGYVDGKGTEARFSRPAGMIRDNDGNFLVCDSGNKCIRKITPDGTVSTFYGGTSGYSGSFSPYGPKGLAMDRNGNLFVSDGERICKISKDGIGSLVAGGNRAGYADGKGSDALFHDPEDIAVDGAGNVFVADTWNHCVRKISPDGTVTTVAGNGTAGFADGIGAAAMFDTPTGIALDAAGYLFVADSDNHCIRRISPNGTVESVVAEGIGANRLLLFGRTMYVAESWRAYKLVF